MVKISYKEKITNMQLREFDDFTEAERWIITPFLLHLKNKEELEGMELTADIKAEYARAYLMGYRVGKDDNVVYKKTE